MPAAQHVQAVEAPAANNIPQTSIATHIQNPDEVTVRFRRWHAHGPTAYQKGQYAGFLSKTAEDMARAGIVDLPPGYRGRTVGTYVTK